MQRGDAFALRARRHHERAALAALDRPGGPTAAVVLDLNERLELGRDGRMVLEGEAEAVGGLVPGDPEVLAEVDPALALGLQVCFVQRARDDSDSSRSAAASRCCVAMFGSFRGSCSGLR